MGQMGGMGGNMMSMFTGGQQEPGQEIQSGGTKREKLSRVNEATKRKEIKKPSKH